MKSVKTGGRQKGTPNKVTGKLKDIISDMLLSYADHQMLKDLNELNPKDRIELFYKMSQYVIPKPKAIELIEPDEQENKILIFIGKKQYDEYQKDNPTELDT